jgi:hypothetical protein
VLEALVEERVAAERDSRVDEGTEVEVRFDAALAHERDALGEHGRFSGIATDGRDQRKLFERLVKRDS